MGGGGGGIIATGCDPAAGDNATRDSDCDGLSDAEEYGTMYQGQKTDPCRSDSDGDGVGDGIELGKTSSVRSSCNFVADADPRSKTVPTIADTDGDGLHDGAEDLNGNGRQDATETSPNRSDSDCDGYSDKEEKDSAAGCATNPLKKDTDGDGLADGLESGLIGPGDDAANCAYPVNTFDSDPTTKTNACNPDSDGDGIQDGAEDASGNGKNEPGELDPNNGGDAAGPATEACSTANLRPVIFSASGAPDVQIALPTEFTEISAVTVNAVQQGYVFYDPTTHVTGLVFSKTPAGISATAEELAGRPKIGTSSVTNPVLQTFTTWDGFATSIRASYDFADGTDAKAAINAIATSFLGAPGGLLQGAAGVSGPFKVQAEYVRRTDTRAVIVIALVPAAQYSGQALFRLDDTANGTAIAQFSDFAGTQCEVFDAAINQKADFLWIVDDSGSMASSQSAVASAGSLFGSKLQNAGLDWRVAAASTGFYPSSWDGKFYDWTSTTSVMQNWFSSGFGINGSPSERGFAAVKSFVNLQSGNSAKPTPFRTDAALHFIFLTDTREQDNSTGPADVKNLMSSKYPGQPFMSHGIVCPEGATCSNDSSEVAVGEYHTLIRNTGGVLGNIMTFNPTSPTPAQQAQQSAVIDGILQAAIGGTGHQLKRPPISSTIKIAIASTKGTCANANVPRDRTNGWDIDAATRRIVFYGNCIPSASGVKVAVSFKYWNENSPNADGDACGATCVSPEVCDPSTKLCICSPTCGGCAEGQVCNTTSCSCDPVIN